MASRALPPRPNLDHLKNEAKALLKAFRDGAPEATARVRDILGDKPIAKLTDAQRVVAREYGFATWARLRAQVDAMRAADPVRAFLRAIQEQNRDAASAVVREHPRIASESLHVAAVLGQADDVGRIAAADPAQVNVKIGDPAADPLLFLAFSPFHGESPERDAGLLESACRLLDAGADPNTVDGQYGVPALYGVTGMHESLPIAKLLLERGANPTDGESMFHSAERYNLPAMELLVSYGCDLNFVGEWGNTPIYFLLRWHDIEAEPKVKQGLHWLLEHGADPNVRCGKESETSLHVAARRGQSPATVRLLIDHGADVGALRADGRSAWLLATRAGHEGVAQLLEQMGASPESLTPLDALLAACGRGDAQKARELSSSALVASLSAEDLALLPDAAARNRLDVVNACLAAGFPPSATDAYGTTALHRASIEGWVAIVKSLLSAGASHAIKDPEHNSKPLGWALFGSDISDRTEPDSNFPETVRALLEAGARLRDDEYHPNGAAVRAVLAEFEERR